MQVAVHDLCLGIPAGQRFGFLGPNGAGKTTTLSILSGDQQATSGDALVAGQSLVRSSGASPRGALLGYCPQQVGQPCSPRHCRAAFLLPSAVRLIIPVALGSHQVTPSMIESISSRDEHTPPSILPMELRTAIAWSIGLAAYVIAASSGDIIVSCHA